MLVVDAGPLVAAAATRDRNHQRCVELLRNASRPLVVPQLVVTEVAYFLADRIGSHAELAFARSLAARELLVEPVAEDDWPRIEQLCRTYDDLALGIVDASVITTCERLAVSEVASLDHRHLAVVRPAHVEALRLLPG